MDNASKFAKLAQAIHAANLPGLRSICFLMTKATFDEIQNSSLIANGSDDSNEKPACAAPGSFPHSSSLFSIGGIPFEVFSTTRECLDRAMELGQKVRPVLLLIEPIPDDCKDHPIALMLREGDPNYLPSMDASTKNLGGLNFLSKSFDEVINSFDCPKFQGRNFDEVFGSPGRRYRGQAPHVN